MNLTPTTGRWHCSALTLSLIVLAASFVLLSSCSTREEKSAVVETEITENQTPPSTDEDVQQSEIPQYQAEVVKPFASTNTSEETEGEPEAEPSVDNETASGEEAPGIIVQASPLRGFSAVYDYLADELKSPAEALKEPIQEIVTVSFVINTEGRPESIELDKSLDESFEKELKRVIENMPQWRAATLDGNPIPSKVVLPLDFRP